MNRRSWRTPWLIASILLSTLAMPPGYSHASNTTAANKYYTAKDSSVIIPKCVRPKLEAIAAAFHKKTGQTLVVTDGTRTVKEQARLVYINLAEGKNIVRLYAAKKLAKEVTSAFKAVPKADQATRGKQAIEQTLHEQVKRGEFLSKHMREGALDLRTNGLSKSQLNALKKEVRGKGVRLVDETKGKRPHYHLNFMTCVNERK